MNYKTINETRFYYGKQPLAYMLERKQDNEIPLCQQSNEGRAFGSMDYAKLATIFTENHHLYEICGDKRRFIFDIEFTTDSDPTLQFEYIKQCTNNILF